MYIKPVVITDFTNLANQKWEIINDDVMGGQSESQFQINKDGNAVFLGHISLKNSGGFASVRNHEPLNLSGFNTIRLTVKGDGNQYSFRLKPNTENPAANFWYEDRFQTKNGEWIEIELALKDFEPTYRGRKPQNAATLDVENIEQFGFLISDKQKGEFRLEINKIEALPDSHS
ncbi:CIA30 family protein [Rhodohalobacter barkolensis]|uniref:CIA30 family protein n=1 Tax=Rhodohalobacter barkolensis TaxID=2053187 RepID=A0A2N0VLP3_9BACT|nr:CIA30 family protein [Rhodohalobacter barkolensis]PKD45102.1 CIA30 family protein [Rhodohalobacter barkolensis]